MQPGATTVFGRLGLTSRLEAAGAVPNGIDLWTRYGWIRPPDEGLYGYNVRRSVLDPMLRDAAAGTPGVDLRLGVKATGLIRRGGRVEGVQATDHTGEEQRFPGRVVVGADGRHFPVASWAGVPVKKRKHGRFIYFASFEDVPLPRGPRSLMWFTDPDVAYVFPNDGGTTVVAVMLTADELADFRRDVDGNLRRLVAGLPDAPDLSRARRVSDYVGVPHHPDVSRRAAAPGLALVGDAAPTTDYQWGVGCGWALESAVWLADGIGPVLSGPAPDTSARSTGRSGATPTGTTAPSPRTTSSSRTSRAGGP
ncbi:NAD(P)/FAD-dependent oxidoreductase [Geodermatophilus sp. FMUSA9-8]|uniref:NAD(P)/FAD-dependent oxidoreductase n=1 Tax=Geodermatophilus sp. FMUSA9-8 TaxID=3120155 RepID=UPI003FA55FCC